MISKMWLVLQLSVKGDSLKNKITPLNTFSSKSNLPRPNNQQQPTKAVQEVCFFFFLSLCLHSCSHWWLFGGVTLPSPAAAEKQLPFPQGGDSYLLSLLQQFTTNAIPHKAWNHLRQGNQLTGIKRVTDSVGL